MANSKKYNQLTEAIILDIMREEWEAKKRSLFEVDTSYKKATGEAVPTVSKDLKIKHKKSGLLYTVVALDASMKDALIKSPDGEEIAVSASELEKEYELD